MILLEDCSEGKWLFIGLFVYSFEYAKKENKAVFDSWFHLCKSAENYTV